MFSGEALKISVGEDDIVGGSGKYFHRLEIYPLNANTP